MARGKAVVERAAEYQNTTSVGRSSRNPPLLYMRSRIVKSSSKKEPDRLQDLYKIFGRQFRACDGDVFANNTGGLVDG